MPYEPYLIADLQTGQAIGKEPWLLPKDAFYDLRNAHVHNGVVEKRGMLDTFAQMKHGSTLKTYPIMGIFNYMDKGFRKLLVFDTYRVNKYDPIDGSMTDIAGSDIWGGDSTRYISFVNWLGSSYFVNNKEQVYYYDGQSVAAFNVKFDTVGPTNQLQTARFVFIKDDRLCFLDVVEDGYWYPARLRYGPVSGTDFTTTGAGYIDAPTEEAVICAMKVGRDIVVRMTESWWIIRTTGISSTPFKWDRISDADESRYYYGGVVVGNNAAALGNKNVEWYDGYQIQPLDLPNMRDVLQRINTAYPHLVYGYYDKQKQRIYWSYIRTGHTKHDRVLMYNVIDKNWATYDMTATCFGSFTNQDIPTVVGLDDCTIGDGALVSQMAYDSREIFGSPTPITLVGGNDGKIYQMDAIEPNDVDIEVAIQTGKMNPYISNGRMATLQKVMFYVDSDDDASLTVDLLKDWDTGLIAHYKLDENAADTQVEDSAGIQATATASQNTEDMHATAKVGTGAFTINGTTDYVNIPHHSSHLMTSGGTFAAWIKPASLGEVNGGRVLDKSTDLTGDDGFRWYMTTSNRLGFSVNAGTAQYSAAVTVNGSTWTHVAVVVDEDAIVTHYVNGEVSGTPGATGALSGITTTNDMRIGNRSGATDRTFDGVIDDVRIYNKVLTASDIAAIYNDGSGVAETHCVGQWKSQTLSCEGTREKTWVTIHGDGETAPFHQVRFRHTDNNANRPRIHAIMPYFKQGGRI